MPDKRTGWVDNHEFTRAVHEEFAALKARAERAHQAFGDTATPCGPLEGESLLRYRQRLASRFKQHSPAWGAVELAKLDLAALEVAERAIYADAMDVARRGADLPDGQVRMVTDTDQTGRKIHRFVARSDEAAWKQFSNPDLTVRINTRF